MENRDVDVEVDLLDPGVSNNLLVVTVVGFGGVTYIKSFFINNGRYI